MENSSKKKGCLKASIYILVAIVILSVFAVFAINKIANAILDKALETLGFNSRAEYTAFMEDLNSDFDEASLYEFQEITENDVNNSKSLLNTNVNFVNDESILNETGNFNCTELDSETNLQLLNSFSLSQLEFLSLSNLFLNDIFQFASENIENNVDNTYYLMNYFELVGLEIVTDLANTNCTLYVKLDSEKLKSEIDELEGFIPDKLYFKLEIVFNSINLDLISNSIHFNNLSDLNNTKFCNLINIVYEDEENGFTNYLSNLFLNYLKGIKQELNCEILFDYQTINFTMLNF